MSIKTIDLSDYAPTRVVSYPQDQIKVGTSDVIGHKMRGKIMLLWQIVEPNVKVAGIK